MRDEDLRAAEAIIQADEDGAYDIQRGISPDQRALLTKVDGTGPLTPEDARALNAMGCHELTVAAHDAGRFDTTDEEN